MPLGDSLARCSATAQAMESPSKVAVEEQADELVFLHQVMPGGASRSYGIEAARLAGVPTAVVQRARQVLKNVEAGHHLTGT